MNGTRQAREVVLDLFSGAAQHRLLLGHLPLTDALTTIACRFRS